MLLKELDQYLSPDGGVSPLQEVARGCDRSKSRDNLGVRFKLMVQDHQWQERGGGGRADYRGSSRTRRWRTRFATCCRCRVSVRRRRRGRGSESRRWGLIDRARRPLRDSPDPATDAEVFRRRGSGLASVQRDQRRMRSDGDADEEEGVGDVGDVGPEGGIAEDGPGAMPKGSIDVRGAGG